MEDGQSEQQPSDVAPALLELLSGITPTVNEGVRQYPCQATLRSGRTVERLLCVQASQGLYEGDTIDPSTIVAVEEAPCRLPAEYAERLLRYGETCMGGVHFTLEFPDGKSCLFLEGSGGAYFLDYPEGRGPSDIVRMIPGRPEWDERGVGHRGHVDFEVCYF